MIASILGTKTESHVRSFFVNYRRRYDLDVIYKVGVGSVSSEGQNMLNMSIVSGV